MNVTQEPTLEDLSTPVDGDGVLYPITPKWELACFYTNDIELLKIVATMRNQALLVVDYGRVRIITPDEHSGTAIVLETMRNDYTSEELRNWINENI